MVLKVKSAGANSNMETLIAPAAYSVGLDYEFGAQPQVFQLKCKDSV